MSESKQRQGVNEEAELLLLDDERARRKADTVRLYAEAAKASAEAKKIEHEADVASRMATGARIAEDRELDKRRRELKSDDELRVYRFVGTVNSGSCEKAINTLALWERLDAENESTIRLPYRFVINSPGGEIMSGFGLYDYLRSLSANGHKIITEGFGLVASMGTVLFQAGDERYISPGASFLIHSASFGAQGEMGQVEDTVAWVKLLQNRIFDILAERSTLPRKTIVKNAERRDWTMLGAEVVNLGFADALSYQVATTVEID